MSASADPWHLIQREQGRLWYLRPTPPVWCRHCVTEQLCQETHEFCPRNETGSSTVLVSLLDGQDGGEGATAFVFRFLSVERRCQLRIQLVGILHAGLHWRVWVRQCS